MNTDTNIAGNYDTETPPRHTAPEQDPEQELPFWNALQIVRQSTGKGKIRYLIRWEDPTAPDSWSDAADVNDELKRVFYLTHTKTGARRLHPIKNMEQQTLAVIWELKDLVHNKQHSSIRPTTPQPTTTTSPKLKTKLPTVYQRRLPKTPSNIVTTSAMPHPDPTSALN